MLVEELEKRMTELSVLYEISSIPSGLDLGRIMDLTVDMITRVMRSERGAILILNEDTQRLEVKKIRGFGRVNIDEISAELEKEVDKALKKDKIKAASIKGSHKNFACVPLRVRDEFIGVIYSERLHPREYSPDELRLLTILADRVSTALENARMYEELKKTKGYLEDVLNSSLDLIFTVKKDGTFGYFNERLEEVTGYREEDMVGKHFIDFIPEDMKEFMQQKWEEINRGISSTYETKIIKADGTIAHCLVSHSILKDYDEFLVILKDITERKRVEEALRESEEKFRLAFENAKDAIFWGDPKTGLITNCNKAAEALLEKKREEIIGCHQTTLHPPQKAEYYANLFKKHIRQKGTVDDEAEVITKSGKIKPVHITASVTLIGGKPVIQGIFRDITERKRAEKALQERERFLSNIFASIQDGLSILDKDMNIVRVNPTVERWYSHAMPLVGKKCYQAYHGRRNRCKVCPSHRTLQTGEAAYEVIPKRGPGREVVGWLDLYSFPLVDTATGHLNGVIEYARDITERKRVEKRLKEKIEELERFNRLAVGRELKMIELKERIEGLEAEIKRLREG